MGYLFIRWLFIFLSYIPHAISSSFEVFDSQHNNYAGSTLTFQTILKVYKGDGTLFDIKDQGRYQVIKSSSSAQENKAIIDEEQSISLKECLFAMKNATQNDQTDVEFFKGNVDYIVLQLKNDKRKLNLYLYVQKK